MTGRVYTPVHLVCLRHWLKQRIIPIIDENFTENNNKRFEQTESYKLTTLSPPTSSYYLLTYSSIVLQKRTIKFRNKYIEYLAIT